MFSTKGIGFPLAGTTGIVAMTLTTSSLWVSNKRPTRLLKVAEKSSILPISSTMKNKVAELVAVATAAPLWRRSWEAEIWSKEGTSTTYCPTFGRRSWGLLSDRRASGDDGPGKEDIEIFSISQRIKKKSKSKYIFIFDLVVLWEPNSQNGPLNS